MSTFSPGSLHRLDVAARVSACLSLVGSSWTMISYLCYRPLRKPVNRFSFCISISNTMACVAYSWGRYPVAAGRNSAFCQTQGFLITWFVMTDPLLVCNCRRLEYDVQLMIPQGHSHGSECLLDGQTSTKSQGTQEDRCVGHWSSIRTALSLCVDVSLLAPKWPHGVW